jgi:hypothetical protein
MYVICLVCGRSCPGADCIIRPIFTSLPCCKGYVGSDNNVNTVPCSRSHSQEVVKPAFLL